MCGIIGQQNQSSPVPVADFEKMVASLAHRGPDAQGIQFLFKGQVALGNRRLSIIDLSAAGNQPIANEDSTVWITYNGELYNFRELRIKLIGRGHRFRSESDSEVVLHAYEEWGPACLHHFRGIYAFGIWDEPRERLWLARDRIGVKPLYYYTDHQRIIFASELKAIMGNSTVPRDLNFEALSGYLTYGYVPHDQAILKNVSKLPAGHHLTYFQGRVDVEEYWDVHYSGEIENLDTAKAQLSAALTGAVSSQLVSDVPIGVNLSGGVDSSAVTALMAGLQPDRFNTFTIGFQQSNFDESPKARLVAELFQTRHLEKQLSDPDILRILAGYSDLYDEPFYDSSGLPTYLVSELARQYVKVVLGGDGGDELFAGYGRYDRTLDATGLQSPSPVQAMLARFLARPLRGFARLLPSIQPLSTTWNQRSRDLFEVYSAFIEIAPMALQRKVLHPQVLAAFPRDPRGTMRRFWRPEYPRITALQYLDLKTYLVDDILTKVDRASMAHGLEVRVPLLDHHVVELVFKISHKLIYAEGEKKHLFKQALSALLPDQILSGPKKGFTVPMHGWLEEGLRKQAVDSLQDGSLASRQVLNPDTIGRVLPRMPIRMTWLFLVLEMWSRRWLEGEKAVTQFPVFQV